AILQSAKGLAQAAAFIFELVGGFGVEGEHIEMVRDGKAGTSLASELSRFKAVEVSRDAPFGLIAIDRHQGHVESEGAQCREQAFMPNSIAAVIDLHGTDAYDVA